MLFEFDISSVKIILKCNIWAWRTIYTYWELIACISKRQIQFTVLRSVVIFLKGTHDKSLLSISQCFDLYIYKCTFQVSCPPDFTFSPQTGTCHLLRDELLNYWAAASFCQSFGSDVHLVALETQEEETYIVDEIVTSTFINIVHFKAL